HTPQDLGNHTNFSIHVPCTTFDRGTTAQVVLQAMHALGIDADVNERNNICVGGEKAVGLGIQNRLRLGDLLRVGKDTMIMKGHGVVSGTPKLHHNNTTYQTSHSSLRRLCCRSPVLNLGSNPNFSELDSRSGHRSGVAPGPNLQTVQAVSGGCGVYAARTLELLTAGWTTLLTLTYFQWPVQLIGSELDIAGSAFSTLLHDEFLRNGLADISSLVTNARKSCPICLLNDVNLCMILPTLNAWAHIQEHSQSRIASTPEPNIEQASNPSVAKAEQPDRNFVNERITDATSIFAGIGNVSG
ncbi:hypothetical protein EV702DRAFT_1212012, partial [Suillus placidus]